MNKADAVKAVAKALVARTGIGPARAKAIATAYIDAAIERASAVTTAAEPPPTAMKSAQVALLLSLIERFEDVPTPAEIAALLRVTPSAGGSLLAEILATSDDATDWLLKGVFGRAKKGGTVDADHPIPHGRIWELDSLSDLKAARERLEFRDIAYRTKSTKDSVYELVVDPDFDRPE